MDEHAPISVTIVNRNYPPSSGITGVSAHQLAGYLEAQGIEVKIVTIDGQYGGGVLISKVNGKVFKLPAWYNGKHKLKRLIGTFIESFHLVKKAIKVNRGTIILMTDPPFLHFWAALLLNKNTPWILWTMDLYPEAFAANGLIDKENFIYRFYMKIIKRITPKKVIALGSFQAEYINKRYKSTIPNFILPCGVFHKKDIKGIPKWHEGSNKIHFGYVGNLGEAHSLIALKTLIEQLDPIRHHFILSVYGSKATSILEFVKDNPVVTVVEKVERHQLTYIDIHTISLLPSWNNICVPSKAVSGVCAGSTILFFGSQQIDTWDLLQNAGWMIKEDNQLRNRIKLFLSNLSPTVIATKKEQSEQVSVNLQAMTLKGFEQIAAHIKHQEVLEERPSLIPDFVNQMMLVTENNSSKYAQKK